MIIIICFEICSSCTLNCFTQSSLGCGTYNYFEFFALLIFVYNNVFIFAQILQLYENMDLKVFN